jgi:hypothetical protein
MKKTIIMFPSRLPLLHRLLFILPAFSVYSRLQGCYRLLCDNVYSGGCFLMGLPVCSEPKNKLSISNKFARNICKHLPDHDRFCGLVVRVLGYRSGGTGSIPGTTKKKVVGLEWGPLSLVSTTEELFDRKVAAPV